MMDVSADGLLADERRQEGRQPWFCAGALLGDGSVLLGHPNDDAAVVQAIVPPGVPLPDAPDGKYTRNHWRLAKWEANSDQPVSEMPAEVPEVWNYGRDAHFVILWFLTNAPEHLNWFAARLKDAVRISIALDNLETRRDLANNLRRYLDDLGTVEQAAAHEHQLDPEAVGILVRKLDPFPGQEALESAEPETVAAC